MSPESQPLRADPWGGGGLFTRLLVIQVVIALVLGGLAILLSVFRPGPDPGRTIILTLIGVVSWIVVVTWLVRRLSKSVGHLESAAQRVAGGDYGPIQRVPMPTGDLERLQDAFVQMIERLDSARSDL